MTEPDSGAKAPESEIVEGAAAPEKRKRRKKRKREASADGATPGREPLDAQGRERAEFLLDLPEDAELEPLIAAFERGDYRRVREGAPGVAARHADPSVQAAARELLRRIEPDPLVKFLYGAAVALFVVVTALAYLSHG